MQSYTTHSLFSGSSAATPRQTQTTVTPTTPTHSLGGNYETRHLFHPAPVPGGGSHAGSVTAAVVVPAAPESDVRKEHSSSTWTSSSGGADLFEDVEHLEDRSIFVHEYNRLAKKHGVRLLVLDDYGTPPSSRGLSGERRSWFSRTFCRHPSGSSCSRSTSSTTQRKQSIGELGSQAVTTHKKDGLKDEDLQSLVRFCGKSVLYLPPEYMPTTSLVLPTCLRATAYFLAQHASETRGVFRIPGSVRVVKELYNYYCSELDDESITGTVRSPNLPLHIKFGVHDVASTFKRILSRLPGGILGHLSLFDAMVAIHSQLHGDPEFNRTKRSKLRARLIALAIGTLRSQLRRELICAVFGLLCLIGRAAEVAPREDNHGRPLPTSDMMGYSALGIIFGPLLVGDLIDSYSTKLADPAAGLVLLPLTPPPKSRSEKRRRSTTSDKRPTTPLTVDKVHVANNIAEMLITHWREVVRHMRSLDIVRKQSVSEPGPKLGWLRPSASETFTERRLNNYPSLYHLSAGRISPTTLTPLMYQKKSGSTITSFQLESTPESLALKRQRPKLSSQTRSANGSPTKPPLAILSPTAEESFIEFTPVRYKPQDVRSNGRLLPATRSIENVSVPMRPSLGQHAQDECMIHPALRTSTEQHNGLKPLQLEHTSRTVTPGRNAGPEDGALHSTAHSKSIRREFDDQVFPAQSDQEDSQPVDHKESVNQDQVENFAIVDKSGRLGRPRRSDDSTRITPQVGAGAWKPESPSGFHEDATYLALRQEMPQRAPVQDRKSRKQGSSPALEGQLDRIGSEQGLQGRGLVGDGEPQITNHRGIEDNHFSGLFTNSLETHQAPVSSTLQGVGSTETPKERSPPLKSHAKQSSQSGGPRTTISGEASGRMEDSGPMRNSFSSRVRGMLNRQKSKDTLSRHDDTSVSSGRDDKEAASLVRKPQRLRSKTVGATPRRSWDDTGSSFSSRATGSKSVGGRAVKAMAAMFDSAERESQSGGSALRPVRSQGDQNSYSLLSQYTSNPSPTKSPRSTTVSNSGASTPAWVGSLPGTNMAHRSRRSVRNSRSRDNPTTQPSSPEETPSRPGRGSSPRPVSVPRTARSTQSTESSGLPASTSKQLLAPRHNTKPSQTPDSQTQTPTSPPRTLMRALPPGSSPTTNNNTTPTTHHSQHHNHHQQHKSQQQVSSFPTSLGCMLPHVSPPPVPHHITFPPPQPLPQQQPPSLPTALDGRSTTTPSGSGTTSLLHLQIRTLQRRLDTRTEECLALRAQLRARRGEGSDTDAAAAVVVVTGEVGPLSERLRRAQLEAAAWRQRAVVAERRVEALERIIARMRAAGAGGGTDELGFGGRKRDDGVMSRDRGGNRNVVGYGGGNGDEEGYGVVSNGHGESEADVGADGTDQAKAVAVEGGTTTSSASAGTEDGDVFWERLKNRLRGMDGEEAAALDDYSQPSDDDGNAIPAARQDDPGAKLLEDVLSDGGRSNGTVVVVREREPSGASSGVREDEDEEEMELLSPIDIAGFSFDLSST